MIWIREVNSALLNHIKTIMTGITDHYNKPLDVGVIVRLPDIDLEKEEYPKISIGYLQTVDTDFLKDVNSFNLHYTDNNTVIKKKAPTKYKFQYQLDFWSKTPFDRDAMTYAWVSNNTKISYLDVLDSNKVDIVPCYMKLSEMKVVDMKNSSGENIYRNVQMCDIVVSVENDKGKEYPVISNVNIK